jgi:hypothetical protein
MGNSQRVLIVIPNRSLFVTAWCYENAFRLIAEGFKVEILDLARYESRYLKTRAYWYLDSICERNDIRKIVKVKLVEIGVKFINEQSLIDMNLKNLEKNDEILFREVFKSCYAKLVGTRDYDLQEINETVFNMDRDSYAIILNNLRRFLKSNSYNYVYTVNGRTFFDSCAIQVAKEYEIPYRAIEKTSENWQFYSLQRISTHSTSEVQEKVSIFWERWLWKQSVDKTSLIVSEYFRKNSSEKSNPWMALQTLKPENISNLSKTAIFFTTSDYEYSVHADPRDIDLEFRNQTAAFRALAEQSKKIGLEVAVRVHPHIGSTIIEKKLNEIWGKECKRVGARLFEANCGINSMQLAKRAFTNAVYVSNIGAEMIYYNLPLIILGKTSYSHLVPEICATDSISLFQLLKSRSVLSIDRIFPWVIYRQFGEVKVENFIIRSASEVFYEKKRLNEKRIWIFRSIRFLAKFKLYKIKVVER